MSTDLTDAQATLARFVADLDRRFNATDGHIGQWMIFANGDRVLYETWCSDGHKAEGELRKAFKTPASAVKAYIKVMALLGTGDEQVLGRIFWRTRPTVERAPNGWGVQSRFVISTFEPAEAPVPA